MHRYPGIFLLAEKNSGKSQLGDRLKTVQSVLASNGVSYPSNDDGSFAVRSNTIFVSHLRLSLTSSLFPIDLLITVLQICWHIPIWINHMLIFNLTI